MNNNDHTEADMDITARDMMAKVQADIEAEHAAAEAEFYGSDAWDEDGAYGLDD